MTRSLPLIHSVLLGKSAMAMLAVIQSEASATGECTPSVAQIAKRANVGRAKVRAAIRLAESIGAIATEDVPNRTRVIVNRSNKPRC